MRRHIENAQPAMPIAMPAALRPQLPARTHARTESVFAHRPSPVQRSPFAASRPSADENRQPSPRRPGRCGATAWCRAPSAPPSPGPFRTSH